MLCGTRARAGGPLGDQGSRIQTSGYTVDLFQGPVLATSRITGLGAAYTAIAEGADGITFNPAGVSVRPPWSTTRDDYDITGGVTFPNSITGTDFDNNGSTRFTTKSFVWGTLGGYVQHDALGIGAIMSVQNYSLGDPDPGKIVPLPGTRDIVQGVIIRVLRLDAVASYGFLDQQLHLGGGFRLTSFYGVGDTKTPEDPNANPPIKQSEQERLLLNTNAIGVQAGALWTPRQLPLRIGAAVRSPMLSGTDDGRIAKDDHGDRKIGNLFLPEKVELPWEVEGGVALQLWKRPLNLPWTDEDSIPSARSERWRRTVNGDQVEPPYKGARRLLRARYREIPRERVLLTGSVLLSGMLKDAVGFESMLSQTVDRSGEKLSVTVRGGVETEIIPWWLVLRAGSYLEPTRFRQSSSRVHATGGLDVRLVEWSVFGLFDEHTIFRLSGAVDVAPGRDYFGWSVGLGVLR